VLEDKRQARRLSYGVWQLVSESGVLWRLVELCQYHRSSVAEPDVSYSEQEGTLWARYYSSLNEDKLPSSAEKGEKLDSHFSELKIPRNSRAKTAAWLASVGKQQNNLKIGMELAKRLFLKTLRSGGAD
jgi:hypothetical protein